MTWRTVLLLVDGVVQWVGHFSSEKMEVWVVSLDRWTDLCDVDLLPFLPPSVPSTALSGPTTTTRHVLRTVSSSSSSTRSCQIALERRRQDQQQRPWLESRACFDYKRSSRRPT